MPAEKDPSRIYPLYTMAGAREVDGKLWILIAGEADKPATFYILDAESGDRRGRLTVATPGPVNTFTVDAGRGQLYLAIPDEASILSVDLTGLQRF
jgi:hypothetical protein